MLYHCFINWIRCFVGEYTSWQTRNYFVYICFVADEQYVVVDLHVLSLRKMNMNEISFILYGFDWALNWIPTKKSRLLLILWNKPPTIAAKCMTLFGLYFSNSLRVDSKSLWERERELVCESAQSKENIEFTWDQLPSNQQKTILRHRASPRIELHLELLFQLGQCRRSLKLLLTFSFYCKQYCLKWTKDRNCY